MENKEVKIIRTCARCREVINEPEDTWDLWVVGHGEYLAVCSEYCRVRLQDKEDKWSK